jgi:hypothetical protein
MNHDLLNDDLWTDTSIEIDDCVLSVVEVYWKDGLLYRRSTYYASDDTALEIDEIA